MTPSLFDGVRVKTACAAPLICPSESRVSVMAELQPVTKESETPWLVLTSAAALTTSELVAGHVMPADVG